MSVHSKRKAKTEKGGIPEQVENKDEIENSIPEIETTEPRIRRRHGKKKAVSRLEGNDNGG